MRCKLSDICVYRNERISTNALNSHTYVSTENMLPDKGGITDAASLPTVSQTSKFRYGDTLVSNIRPYFKKIWFAEYDGGCSNDVLVFSAKEGVDPKYVYYVLANDSFFAYSTATSKGTKMPRGDKTSIMQYQIEKVDSPTQKKIAAILSALDEKITTNRAINDNLQQQAQALFVAWFVNFIPFGGTAPDDWQYVRFTNFLTPRTEKSNDPSLPMFSVTDTGIYPRDEKFKKNLSMSNTKNKVIYNTDLVFGMSREILNWGIMRYAIGGVSSAYNVFSVSDTINSFYLESYIKHNGSYFRDLIKPASREGQGIDKNVLMQKQILLPPFDVLQSYYSIENALTRKVAYNQAENARLAELRDTLLPRLMTGEIDVSNINI